MTKDGAQGAGRRLGPRSKQDAITITTITITITTMTITITTSDNQQAAESSAAARAPRDQDDRAKKAAAKTDVEFVAPLNGFNWTYEAPGRR